jgi:8-oxo-dGTP pyrophosphatase MutT (NUDIX family)
MTEHGGQGEQAVPRRAGRVLVLDEAGRVLLLHGYDPARPDKPYWLTVGGGAKPDESLAQAAVRELAEEVGLVATPEALGEPVWHEVIEFGFDGTTYRQEQDFFLLRVATPVVRTDGMKDEEAAVIDGYRWWSAADLESTPEAIYPAELPRLLRELNR